MIYAGGPDGPDPSPTWEYESPGGGAGYGLGRLGDIDQDGYDDLVLGVPGVQPPHDGVGALWLYFGGPTGPGGDQDIEIYVDSVSTDGFGVAALGVDVDGDTRPELIVTEPGSDSLYVFDHEDIDGDG